MSSHHRNHHRSSSMAASTTAATNSGHNNNYASNPTNGSTRYMNHPNLSTASIHVSNPSTTNNAARIRQLWQAFERACANGRSNMEHAFATAKSRSGVEQAQTIRTSYFEKIRMEWQSRLQGAGLQPEQWTDMTEDEMSNVARVLGDDEDGSDGEDSDDSVEEADEDVRERRSGYSSAHAPSMMSSSTRSGNISTSTASSYALVNPSVLNSEEEDDFFFNSASVMVTSHDLTSDDDDGYMSHSHHSHASHTQYSAAKAPSAHLGQWNHNASTDSLDSSHSNHNAGYFSATSSTSASRPAPLTSTASYNHQSYQQQPNTPRSNVFPSTSNTVPQRPKLTSQYSSASTYAGNASAGTASKAPSGSTVPVVAPKPRQAYIGPHLFDDTELEPGSAEVKNASGADGSSAELSADEEADFEAFKMRTRMLKIVEFHQAAALAEIKLAVAIYGERRKALLASAAAAAPQASSASLLVNGKNAKGKVNGKEKENVDQDSSRRTERISISARLAEHERRMVELQKEKEEERKEMVKEERRRRREELESKKQAAAAANGVNGLKATTAAGTGKGRGRSGTATATTPAMRRGSVSAVSGTSNAAPPITSNAPNTVTNPRSRPGRSGTLIGAINSRPSQAPAPSAPTPAPMLAPKASAPVHPAWLDDFGSGGNAEEEEEEGGWDEEEAKGRLEEPFDLEKILSGEDSVEKLLANMLGSNAGATAGASNAANGNAKGSPSLAAANTTAFHPSQTVRQYFPPSQTQPQPLAGISSASSSAASSLYHGSSGGKRRMSDAASIASGMSGMSGASGMMHGMMGSGVANAKRKAHAPKMQKKPSLFGDDSDSDDEDEDEGSSEEEEAESNSPSPRGHDLASADALLTSELMQDPVIAAQIAQYLPGGGGSGGASSAFGGIGDRRGFLPEAAASAFGYESWGVPSQTKPSKLMAPSSSSNPSQASLWSNPAAAHSTTNLTSTLHAPVATPPTLASALLGSSSNQMKTGRATPMPTASTPAPSGWKKLGNSAAGKAPGVRPPSQLSRPQSQAQGHVPTPVGGLVHAPQIPGLAPHQAQAFLESQKQMQAAQFGFGAGINMNDPYALAAAALESTLTGTSNPFGGATMGGSGYVSSSGDGYLGVGKKAKKASPFGSDDDEEGNVQGAVAAWAAGMGAGANSNARGKIGMAGSMMMGLSNPFSQQSHASAGMNSTKGKGKMGMSGWGLPVQQQQQQGGGAMEDGWGMEYVNGNEEQEADGQEEQEQEQEEDVWGAPSKTVASAWSAKTQAVAQSGKSAVNGKKVASPSIVNMSAAANAKALKEKLEKEKAEKERLEKEKEKEEKEQAAAAAAAAQPPASGKKQTKKQKQAAKKGGGAAAASQPEPEPEQKEPTPPPSPPSPPAPEPSAISLMSRILPGKGRGRKDSVSVISSSSPSISGAANASGGGIFGGWDDKESSLNGGSSFSAMSAATPRQASKIPGSIFEQQPQADEFGAGFGTPKQGNLFKSSAASAWGSAMNTNSTIRASNANSGASAKGSLRSLFGGGGQSSFSIPGAFDDGNDQDDGGGGGVENGEEETKEDEWDSWSAPTKKGAAATAPTPPTKAAPAPAPSPPASSPTVATNTGGGGKKGKGKKGGKGANNNNTSPAIANANAKGPTTNNKLPKPAIEVVPDEDDNQVKGGTLPSDSKHIMEDANPDADVAIDLVNVLGEERAAALMREARENEAKLGGISTPSPAPAPAAKGNANGNGKSAWGAKSEGATGKGGVPTPAVNSTPVWGQAVRRGGKAGGKLF